MGLAVGVASHLVWDIVSVANYPTTYIRHLDGFAGAVWAISNTVIGIFIAYYLTGRAALPFQSHADNVTDSEF